MVLIDYKYMDKNNSIENYKKTNLILDFSMFI